MKTKTIVVETIYEHRGERKKKKNRRMAGNQEKRVARRTKRKNQNFLLNEKRITDEQRTIRLV